MSNVHPDVEAVLAAGRLAGALPFEALAIADARQVHAARRRTQQLPAEAVAERQDFTVPGSGGAIGLRLYRPVGTALDVLPCLVFLHGGGWMLGSLDSHDALCCRLANQAECCVVAVDYRLAPEHPFPAAIEDCEAAYRAVVARASEWRIDASRIAVGGDSAGGNLAAVLALMATDGAFVAPVHQCLIYPVVDVDRELQDYGPDSAGMGITGRTMVHFRDHYVPNRPDRATWRASPIKAPSLAGLPSTLVVTCGHDPLMAEGIAYARRLETEGVRVVHLHLSDQTHGMITMTQVIRPAIVVQDFVASSLRDAFAVARRPGGRAATETACDHERQEKQQQP